MKPKFPNPPGQLVAALSTLEWRFDRSMAYVRIYLQPDGQRIFVKLRTFFSGKMEYNSTQPALCVRVLMDARKFPNTLCKKSLEYRPLCIYHSEVYNINLV